MSLAGRKEEGQFCAARKSSSGRQIRNISIWRSARRSVSIGPLLGASLYCCKECLRRATRRNVHDGREEELFCWAVLKSVID